MIDLLKESLWKQFGASIDMLKNAVALWPEERWNSDKKFFYNAYHCLVFLDYYLTNPPKDFTAALPFTNVEPGEIPADAIDDVLPNRIYSKQELLDYVNFNREKCSAAISGLTEEKLNERWIEEGSMNYAFIELLFYNMRHVQHHAAQLNMMLRQTINRAPGWVARVGEM